MKFNTLLTTDVDIAGNKKNLFLEIEDSSNPDYTEVKLYYKLNGSKNPDVIEDVYSTTLPLEAIDELSDTLIEYLRTKVMEKL